MAVLLKWSLALAIGSAFATAASAATLDPALLPKVRAATFEVVAAKADDSKVTYEKPLPLDQLPFQERNDHYSSLGTAFAIGDGRYVTAFHVFMEGVDSLQGPLMLRDEQGHVYAINQILRASPQQDFVEFSLTKGPTVDPLPVERAPAVNEAVFAVGNALGTGVVLRDGLYTSDTPEEVDGRWKWLRFSAPASPGNSGGPLVDDKGKVIGVVLRKSPNENLNFALPIGQVLDASDHSATVDVPEHFSVPFSHETRNSRLKATVPLPMAYADFTQRIGETFDNWAHTEAQAWMNGHNGTLFPEGKASHDLLTRGPWTDSLPAMVTQDSDGNWVRKQPARKRTPTADQGFVEETAYDQTVVWHIHANADKPALGAGGRAVMDLLLTQGLLRRDVGPDKVRVTSLGAPYATETITDRQGRTWTMQTFGLPFMNGCLVLASTPTPDGAVGMFRFAMARDARQIALQLRLMADMEDIAFHGSVPQWQAFLANGAPATVLRDATVRREGNVVTVAADGMKATWPADLVPLEGRAEVAIEPSWTYEDSKPALHVRTLVLQQRDTPEPLVKLDRYERYFEDSQPQAQSLWHDLMTHAHPRDGQPVDKDDRRFIVQVYDPAHPDRAQHAFVLTYAVGGKASDDDMRARLKQAAAGVTVPDAKPSAP
ncbi:S1 family peptidase [Luteibacter aegosomatissinici]|uniref:S1 family peptidase n=1 Tax=Luteibacter aegosomatissinici TaxID=2911539 RepID=UPI001FFA9562|nr:serine protease [Luteibacter aegosomatissinici]UPG95752.1 trypsin-like peptidase domain-containing protein [Luteibacter aegosomatissinici]